MVNEQPKQQPKSNVQKITEYLETGNPLRQAFIMEAVGRYAEELLKNAHATRMKMAGGFVNPDRWLDCAQTWKDTVEPK